MYCWVEPTFTVAIDANKDVQPLRSQVCGRSNLRQPGDHRKVESPDLTVEDRDIGFVMYRESVGPVATTSA